MARLDMNKKFHQIISVICNHLYLCFAMFFVVFAFLGGFLGRTPQQEILSAIMIIFYFSVMYVKGCEIAIYDGKSYTSLGYDIKKPFVWSAVIVAITYMFFALYVFVWKIGDYVPMWLRGAITAMFNFWSIPYMGISGAARGKAMWYVHLFYIFVPTLSLLLGYIAGKNKFYLGAYLKKFTYTKEK